MKIDKGYEKVRVHVLVHGVVQGIFFRTNTRSNAQILGVKGWVKNTKDGGIEAVFEGDKDRVEEMVEFCRKGPSGAVITDVKVEWQPYRAEFTDFEIKH